uniref:Uncharacterized protein n=1 Tax=Verticillium dahliae RNA virus TaxID=1945524 RepID=A0A2K8FNV3_9VIRU|nr:hypothetical protein [Verticillium dahliae RNA virus]
MDVFSFLSFAALVTVVCVVGWRAARCAFWLALVLADIVWAWGCGSPPTGLERVPGNVRVSPADGQPERLLPKEAGGVGVTRQSPVSLHLVCNRLRRRARWVNRLESSIGLSRGQLGFVVRGRWTPDLPSASYPAGLNMVLSHFEDGAKLLGGGVVESGEGELVAYHHIELSDGSREVVFPDLLSRLAGYALLRQRDAVLVSALRLRALDWCKKRALPAELSFIVVASAMRLALECSPAEAALAVTLEALGPESPRWWHRA